MKSNILILAVIIALSSCANKKDQMTPTQRIYQVDHLILLPNTSILSADGLYISSPTEKEVFHSAGYVERLEQTLSSFK